MPVIKAEAAVGVAVVDVANVVGVGVGVPDTVIVSYIVLVRTLVMGDGSGVGSTGMREME